MGFSFLIFLKLNLAVELEVLGFIEPFHVLFPGQVAGAGDFELVHFGGVEAGDDDVFGVFEFAFFAGCGVAEGDIGAFIEGEGEGADAGVEGDIGEGLFAGFLGFDG